MNKDKDNSSQDDIYGGFVGKIDPVVFPDSYPDVLKISETEATAMAHRIGKMLRGEKMATPHNVDDWLVMIDMIKEVILNGNNI